MAFSSFGNLGGARVAVLEARMESELARLVTRHGGLPFAFPAVREERIANDDDVREAISDLVTGATDTVVFLTGVAIFAMFEHAERLGQRDALASALARATTICRGPKPVEALRRVGVKPSIVARAPFTTAEVLDALAPLDLQERTVLLVHHGGRSETLTETLRIREVRLRELWLYRWEIPDHGAPLQELIASIDRGTIDALLVTCPAQVTHLFQIANSGVGRVRLAEALASRVVVAAVGSRCSAALAAHGVVADVVPENPKLGPMVVALARYFAHRASERNVRAEGSVA